MERLPPSYEFAAIAVGSTILAGLASGAGLNVGIDALASVIGIAFGYELIRAVSAVHLSSNVMVMADKITGLNNDGDDSLANIKRKIEEAVR